MRCRTGSRKKLDPGTAFKKCAKIVGDVMGSFHPHGDQAIYDALVRLAHGKQFKDARLLVATDTDGFFLYAAFQSILSRAETLARKQEKKRSAPCPK